MSAGNDIGDELIGKVERALGELAARPDPVVEGEAPERHRPSDNDNPEPTCPPADRV